VVKLTATTLIVIAITISFFISWPLKYWMTSYSLTNVNLFRIKNLIIIRYHYKINSQSHQNMKIKFHKILIINIKFRILTIFGKNKMEIY